MINDPPHWRWRRHFPDVRFFRSRTRSVLWKTDRCVVFLKNHNEKRLWHECRRRGDPIPKCSSPYCILLKRNTFARGIPRKYYWVAYTRRNGIGPTVGRGKVQNPILRLLNLAAPTSTVEIGVRRALSFLFFYAKTEKRIEPIRFRDTSSHPTASGGIPPSVVRPSSASGRMFLRTDVAPSASYQRTKIRRSFARTRRRGFWAAESEAGPPLLSISLLPRLGCCTFRYYRVSSAKHITKRFHIVKKKKW